VLKGWIEQERGETGDRVTPRGHPGRREAEVGSTSKVVAEPAD
jgi:hypothetical protein